MFEFGLLLKGINFRWELENIFYTLISNEWLLIVVGAFVLLFFIVFRRD